MSGPMSRRGFLKSLVCGGKSGAEAPADEPDWLAMLPPDFSGGMLEAEAARLGADVGAMTRSELARVVLTAMAGAAMPAPRQEEAPGGPGCRFTNHQEENHVGTDPLS